MDSESKHRNSNSSIVLPTGEIRFRDILPTVGEWLERPFEVWLPSNSLHVESGSQILTAIKNSKNGIYIEFDSLPGRESVFAELWTAESNPNSLVAIGSGKESDIVYLPVDWNKHCFPGHVFVSKECALNIFRVFLSQDDQGSEAKWGRKCTLPWPKRPKRGENTSVPVFKLDENTTDLDPAAQIKGNMVVCPYCSYECIHPTEVEVEPVGGKTSYRISSSGLQSQDIESHSRGVTIRIQFACEKGHVWKTSFSFYKGSTGVATKLTDVADNPDFNFPRTIWRD